MARSGPEEGELVGQRSRDIAPLHTNGGPTLALGPIPAYRLRTGCRRARRQRLQHGHSLHCCRCLSRCRPLHYLPRPRRRCNRRDRCRLRPHPHPSRGDPLWPRVGLFRHWLHRQQCGGTRHMSGLTYGLHAASGDAQLLLLGFLRRFLSRGRTQNPPYRATNQRQRPLYSLAASVRPSTVVHEFGSLGIRFAQGGNDL